MLIYHKHSYDYELFTVKSTDFYNHVLLSHPATLCSSFCGATVNRRRFYNNPAPPGFRSVCFLLPSKMHDFFLTAFVKTCGKKVLSKYYVQKVPQIYVKYKLLASNII